MTERNVSIASSIVEELYDSLSKLPSRSFQAACGLPKVVIQISRHCPERSEYDLTTTEGGKYRLTSRGRLYSTAYVNSADNKNKASTMADGDFIKAVNTMDLDRAKQCLVQNPGCISEVDSSGNNAMHLCVLGMAAVRAPELMQFLLNETSVDLLAENGRGLDVLGAAYWLGDNATSEMLEPYWQRQVDERFPMKDDERPQLRLIRGGKADMDPQLTP